MDLFGFFRRGTERPGGRAGVGSRSAQETTQAETRDRPARVVVVGLDFGTSSVKVAARELTQRANPVGVLDFGTEIEGYSRFAYPSSVSILRGRVCTGTDAERAGPTGMHRSIKMKLLSTSGAVQRLPDWLPRAEGVELHEAEFAASMLLASTIALTEEALALDLGSLDDVRIVYNMDVPVDEFENTASHQRFERVLRIARRVARELTFPCSRNQAVEAWLDAAMAVAQDGTPARSRPLSVVGEAQAILAGISDALRPTPGRPYVCVDIGAGTTDIGIFRLSTWNDIDRVNFFSARTKPIGCDTLDREMCKAAWGELDPEILHAVRIAKRRLAEGQFVTLSNGVRSAMLQPEHLERAVDAISEKLMAHYVQRWKEARDKVRTAAQWEGAGLIVVGGGSLVPQLRALLADAPGAGAVVRSARLMDVHNRSRVRVIGGDGTQPEPSDLVLLTAARGLSFGKPQLRRLVTPDEIEPIADASGPSGDYDFDADDLYGT